MTSTVLAASRRRGFASFLRRYSLLGALLLLAGAAAVCRAGQEFRGEPFGDDPAGQAEWFYSRRTTPPGVSPSAARQSAVSQAARLPVVPWQQRAQTGFRTSGAISGPIPGLAWSYPVPPPLNETLYGYGPASVRVNTIAVSPTNPNVVFIGASFAGIAKSVDGGTHWTYISDSLPSQEITTIVIDTTASNIIYAGTGDAYYAGHGRTLFGVGIYRSVDSGGTWTQFGAATLNNLIVERFAIDPKTSGSQTTTVVYAAVSTGTLSAGGGIFRSLDSGQTWARLATLTAAACYDVVADSFFNNTFYAACDSGIWRTTDAGASWTWIHANPNTDKSRLSMNGSTLFVGLTASNGTLVRTPNGGVTWSTPTVSGWCSTQCFYDLYVAVDPSNANHIFLGGVDAFKSADGTNFTNYAPFGTSMVLHSDHHALAFAPSNPQIIYEGNDGGIYKSGDGGTTWTNLNNNLPGALVVGVGVSADGHMVMGAQDNGTNYYAGSHWNEFPPGGDGGFAKIDSTNSKKLYSTYVAGAPPIPSFTIYRSDNGGTSVVDITPGDAILNRESSMFYPTLWMDQSSSTNILVGFSSVWSSKDSGNTWTTIGQPFTPDHFAISAVAQAPGNPDVLYAGTTSFHVFVTNNARQLFNATWTQTTGNLGHFITGFAVDPTNSQHAYFTLAGYGGGALQHVYKTVNGGGAWTALSGAAPNILPDAPFHDIIIDQVSTTSVYAASDVGVFYSPDAGATWSNMSVGIPTGTIVNSLSMNPVTHQLAAGAYGRGVYSLVVPSTTTVSTLDANGGTVNFNPGTGVVSLSLPVGALSQAATISLSTPTSYPSGASAGSLSATGIGVQIDLAPAIQPVSNVTLSINYDPLAVAAFNPSRFLIARFDAATNSWVPLPSTPAPASNLVTALTNHFSLFQVMQGTPSDSVDTVKAFPNPLRPARGDGNMTFSQLPSGARLSIYTISGVFVREVDADLTGTATWDGTNRNGVNVASGVYFVRAENAGHQKVFKVAVQR